MGLGLNKVALGSAVVVRRRRYPARQSRAIRTSREGDRRIADCTSDHRSSEVFHRDRKCTGAGASRKIGRPCRHGSRAQWELIRLQVGQIADHSKAIVIRNRTCIATCSRRRCSRVAAVIAITNIAQQADGHVRGASDGRCDIVVHIYRECTSCCITRRILCAVNNRSHPLIEQGGVGYVRRRGRRNPAIVRNRHVPGSRGGALPGCSIHRH